MASNSNYSSNEDLITTTGTKAARTVAIFRWPSHRRITLRRRRPAIPTVRLGGKKKHRRGRGRGLLFVRMLRRIRLRWLKLKNYCTLKKLKNYYQSVLKDIMEGGGSMEAFQQRLVMETSFAIPVMGLSFNTFSTSHP